MMVSIVIPCYNVENYLHDCIASVLAQTYNEIELILVDDRSTDRTFEIIKEYAAKYPAHIRVLQNEINQGASSARNNGLKIAKGKYIQFLDADDILLPDKIAHQVRLVSAVKDPVLLVGNYKRKSIDGILTTRSFDPNIDPWIGLSNSALGITSSNLWPRRSLLEIGGWKEGLKSSQEYDLMFRLLRTGIRVEYDNEFLTIVRDRESGSISQVTPVANWKRYIDLRVDILEYLSSSGKLTPKIREAVLQRIFEGVRVLYKFDRHTALSIYNKYIYKNYSPKSSVWVTSSYLLFYRLFGFECAEKVKSVIRKGDLR